MLHKLVPVQGLAEKKPPPIPQPAAENGTTLTLLQSPAVTSVSQASCVTRPGFHHPEAMASPGLGL